MKFQIVEFKTSKTPERFFVETGVVTFKKVFAFIYWPSIVWAKEADANDQAIGYKTYADAVKRIGEIKEEQPIHYRIK